MFDFAVLAIGRADETDRITAVALNFEMKGQRFAFNGHQISILNSNNQAKTIICMATNEIRNDCESSIEAVLASNHKRRRVFSSRVYFPRLARFALFVDSAVEVDPPPAHLQVSLVDPPGIAHRRLVGLPAFLQL